MLPRHRFVIGFIATCAIVLLLLQEAGHVTIFAYGYRYDTPLNFFWLQLLLVFYFLHLLLTRLRWFAGLPKRIKEYREQKRLQVSYHAFHSALRFYAAGRFGQALNQAYVSAQHPQMRSSAYLLAAETAHRVMQFKTRDELLALENHPSESHHAVLMAQATFALIDRDYNRALIALEEAKRIGRRNLYTLQLELKARLKLGQWAQAITLLSSLKKRRALLPVIEIKTAETAYSELFHSVTNNAELQKLWRQMPREYQNSVRLSAAYAQRCLDFMAWSDAYQTLARAFKLHGPAEPLLLQYRRLGADQSNAPNYLKTAEKLLEKNPQPAPVLHCLGLLCQQQSMWGQAENFLQRALRYEKEPAEQRELHLALGHLFHQRAQNGEEALQSMALTHYHEAHR